MHKERWRLKSISHMVYFESFCYMIYYIVSEICIGGHFLEECFYCYFRQIKSAGANESLVPYKHIKKEPYFFWVEGCYLFTWNMTHILSKLKTLKEAIKRFWMSREFFSEVIISQHFQQITYRLIVSVRLQTFVYLYISFAFRLFVNFNVIFIEALLLWNVILHFRLKGFKTSKIRKSFFFYPPPTNLQ